MTDIGGNLDVLAALRGSQNLCLDLIHEPGNVAWAVSKIDDAWEKAYSALDAVIAQTQRGTAAWMGLWCPKRWYPLQCDFSAMISPQMFEQFVAPSLRRLCRFLDFTIYHLDGPGQIPHLDVLLDIPELDGIQWVPGAGNPQNEAPQWFPLYERILSKNKRLVLQCWDNPRDIPAVLERIPHKGLLVSATFSTEAEAREVLHTVRGKCNGLS